MESDKKRILKTPEEYAIDKEVSLKTVYNRIKAGKLETVKMFKKTLIVV